LPIVAQLGEEYDSHAIAAAALQMIYDRSRPAWMQSEAYEDIVTDDKPRLNSGSKPKPVKKVVKTSSAPQASASKNG